MPDWFAIFQMTNFHHFPPASGKAKLKPPHFFAKLVMKNSSCFPAENKTTQIKLVFLLLPLLYET